MAEVPASRTTFGPYVIHEELGVGGMATVHRAELPAADGFTRQVALKRMLPALADSDEGLSSFLREAKLASYLQHMNVASTYELGQIGGTYFIAMELINGHTLHEVMNRCAQMASPMPVSIACALISQILDALDYAHNLTDRSGQPLGIIHRDVSPSNVIVASESGIAKLIDFGIAKASAAGMQTMNLTLKGKWAYMAPEYVEYGQIDARADLFAVGVIAHELLVCRPLFSAADDVTTLTRLRTLEIPAPSRANPSVPPQLDHIVLAALARDPNQRWQTAASMRNALAAITQQLSLEAGPNEIAHWIDELFGAASPFDDAAPTMAGMAAYEDPDEVAPPQAFNPAVLDLAGGPPMRAETIVDEELLELAPAPVPAPAGTPMRGPATPQGTPAPAMSRPPGRMGTPAAANPVVRNATPAAANPVVRNATPAAANPVVRNATPAAANPVVRNATPAAANPVVARTASRDSVPPRMATPAAANPVVPSRTRTPSDANPAVPRTRTPSGASPVPPRTRTPSGANPAVPRTRTPSGANPLAAPLDLDAPPPDGSAPADFDPPMPPAGGVPRDFDPPMPPAGGVPRDFDPPMPPAGGVPRDFDPPMPRTATPPGATPVAARTSSRDSIPPRNEFDAPPPVDSRPLAQMMTSETTVGLAYQDPVPAPVTSALPTPPPNTMRAKAPRAETGAEPLWDIGGLKIEPLTRRADAPTTAPVVVTVHKDKPRVAIPENMKRVLIIAAAVIVTLGLAAVAYVLLA